MATIVTAQLAEGWLSQLMRARQEMEGFLRQAAQDDDNRAAVASVINGLAAPIGALRKLMAGIEKTQLETQVAELEKQIAALDAEIKG